MSKSESPEPLDSKICPKCKSSDISYASVKILKQKVEITYFCNDCAEIWTEMYSYLERENKCINQVF